MELDSTEEKIINATYMIILREGSKKATTKKISSEAGVNEVTIFRKFKNKKNLIEITKNYHLELFISKLREIFKFEGDEEIGDYLKDKFYAIFKLSDIDFGIIKVAMEEKDEVSEKKQFVSKISAAILEELSEFFKLQIEKGKIKDIDSNILSVVCFSVIFQSLILWKVFDEEITYEIDSYVDVFVDMLYNGIKP